MREIIKKIIGHLQKDQPVMAESLTLKALESNPNNLQLIEILAQCQSRNVKYSLAIESYLKVLKNIPDNFTINNNLGRLYKDIGDFDNAYKFSKIALKIQPASVLPKYNFARIFFEQSKYKESLKILDEIYDLSSKDGLTEITNLLIQVLLALNMMDRVKEVIKNYHDIAKYNHFFYQETRMYPENISEKYIEKIHTLIAAGIPNKNKASLYYGLGFYYEYKKKYEDAASSFIEANKIVSTNLRFRPLRNQNRTKKIVSDFDENRVKELLVDIKESKFCDRGSNLIFIMGMPRSGTTLTESILAQVPEIFAAGELNAMINVVDDLKPILTIKSLEEAGSKYLKSTDYFCTNYKVIIDKMPHNFYNAGIIKLALPAAKIIYMERNSHDVALSNFKQYFSSNLSFSSSFFNLAIEYANFEVLTEHWKKIFGEDEIMFLSYEDMVSNSEETIKKIFDYCGYNGFEYNEEERKQFHSNTASKSEVKKGIYVSSVDKASHYKDLLKEFDSTLEQQREFWSQSHKNQ